MIWGGIHIKQAGEPVHMKTATELITITTFSIVGAFCFHCIFMLHAKRVSMVLR